jgi:hypothetical protein
MLMTRIFLVFLPALVRAFALLHFMFTGRAAHEPVFVYSRFNLHAPIRS